ncbi:hypothetical protein ES319_A07G117400v1 [Gossypium barbadense]|uniref:Uncharacterized protein n=2 Tax=Gossypium TaxID=3633 RepID=A0A5J5V2I2_GOSBA|nr:hypothetical protein ES319_A07G117400v1 [Gossypium barbadense]TYH09794.1 hypothetical protein ES288_A07G125600v1 [Gossypium darwinii]
MFVLYARVGKIGNRGLLWSSSGFSVIWEFWRFVHKLFTSNLTTNYWQFICKYLMLLVVCPQ